LENVSIGHGVSLLCWRSGGVEHPHDTPPYPFMPSPTFAHSSNDQRTYSISSVTMRHPPIQYHRHRHLDQNLDTGLRQKLGILHKMTFGWDSGAGSPRKVYGAVISAKGTSNGRGYRSQQHRTY
jgi:hypothetical protein